jgi:hypothetical protein
LRAEYCRRRPRGDTFENRNTGEINFRIVLYGPPNVGKIATLRSAYEAIPAHQKGPWVIFESKAEKTVCFDVAQPEFGECLDAGGAGGPEASNGSARPMMRRCEARAGRWTSR